MKNKVCFGYKENSKGFFVTEDFRRPLFFYFEKLADYTFERYWGSHTTSSIIRYKNLVFRGNHNRRNFWSFSICQGEKNFFIEKKDLCFEYGTYHVDTQKSDMFEIRLDKRTSNSDSSERLLENNQLSLYVEEIVLEMIKQYRNLYEKINDKNAFQRELKNYYEEIIDGTEPLEEIQKIIAESERHFINYSNNEKLSLALKKDVNLAFVLEKIPRLKNFLDVIDMSTLLETQKTFFSPCLCEITIDDWLIEFADVINCEIEKHEFNCQKDAFTIPYILEKYQEKISCIEEKEKFLCDLENELEQTPKNTQCCEMFFDRIECFINRYALQEFQKQKTREFVAKYGNDYIIIDLTDEKKEYALKGRIFCLLQSRKRKNMNFIKN